MDEKPIISVIIPAYNVEGYLRRCLNSLKRQTFTQIEVICIDDGSTDGTGAIADEFTTSEWPRFRCIHTQNQGVSAARNLGIDVAEGDWLMFVDSDDTVHKDYCRLPYKAACHYDADMVIFDNAFDRNRHMERDKNVPLGIIDFETAIKTGGNAVWRRLYRKELFASLRFPVGQTFEDISIMYKLVHEAKRIARINHRLYYYTERKNSISHTFTEKNQRERLMAAIERYEGLKEYGCSDDVMLEYLQVCAVRFLSHTTPTDDPLHKKAEDIADSIKGYPKSMSKKQKFSLLLWKKNKRLFYMISKVYAGYYRFRYRNS